MCTTRVQVVRTPGTVCENPARSQMRPEARILRQQVPGCAAASDVRQSCEQIHGGCEPDSVLPPPASLTDSTFNCFIARTGSPILVKFSATWCELSRSLAPHFEAAAAQLLHVRFANVDIDANPQATRANAVRSVPTLILYRNGKELARHSGAMLMNVMKHWVQASLIIET